LATHSPVMETAADILLDSMIDLCRGKVRGRVIMNPKPRRGRPHSVSRQGLDLLYRLAYGQSIKIVEP